MVWVDGGKSSSIVILWKREAYFTFCEVFYVQFYVRIIADTPQFNTKFPILLVWVVEEKISSIVMLWKRDTKSTLHFAKFLLRAILSASYCYDFA